MTPSSNQPILDAVGSDERPVLEMASALDRDAVVRRVRRLLIALSAMTAILILMTFFVQVEEISKARGDAVPSQRLQVIQTAAGGILSDLPVRDGDRVSAGDLIARFRATDIGANLAQADVRRASLMITSERLDALAEQRPLDLVEFSEGFPDLVSEAIDLHSAVLSLITAQIAAKSSEIEEVSNNLAEARRELPLVLESDRVAEEVLERTRDGVARGIIPRNRLAEVEAAAVAADRAAGRLASEIENSEARLERLQAELQIIQSEARQSARAERTRILEQIAELDAELVALRTESGDAEIRSPVDGIVQNVSDTPRGTVIAPGGTVAEIVPSDGGVVFEARLQPRDIGFVELGQRATIKVDSYDFARFGSVEGEVSRISPSSLVDERTGARYFLVEIVLGEAFVGQDTNHIVTPGMTGEVDIVTGRKSLFQYLLKPIFQSADTAFSER